MNNNMLICSTVILGGVCMTCCFIGHRRIKHKKELASRLRDNICYLLEQGVATFLFGDHSEFNTLCYEVVSELREVYPKIRRIHYRTDYPDADAYTMQFLLDGYEDSICPDGVAAAGKAAYVERNQAMIQASDFCVFYFNNEYLPASRKESKKAITSYQPKSGTGIAFDYMLKELKLSHGFEREKKEALTVAQQKLFFDYMLSHPKDTHWYPVFYVMANTGMRVGEITGLRWSDIDLKKGIIRVNHTLVYYNHRDEKGCYFSINTPKTKAGEREIPMTEGVKQAFLMEREFQSQAEISSKSRVDGYDDFIFVNRYGDVQNQGNLNKALRRMMRDCNDEILEKYGADSDPVLLPQFSCHILRHTFATRLCESGANLKFIQSILGHADVSTTMNIYVDVTDALKKKEITAFDDYMTTKLET